MFDEEELKSAFRKCSRSVHPDHGGSNEAFYAVREAYQVLSDPVKRREWERAYVFEAAAQGHIACPNCMAVNRIRAFKQTEAVFCARCKTPLEITPEQRTKRYKAAIKESVGDLVLTIGAETGDIAKQAIIEGARALKRKLKLGGV